MTDKKNGLYIVSGLDLKREGKWELLITVKKAGVEDSVKFIFPDVLKDRPAKGRVFSVISGMAIHYALSECLEKH